MKILRNFGLIAVLCTVAGCAGRSPESACAAEAWKPYGTYERCLQSKAAELEQLEQKRAISSSRRRESVGRRELW